jgi:hypothetical protein
LFALLLHPGDPSEALEAGSAGGTTVRSKVHFAADWSVSLRSAVHDYRFRGPARSG